MFLHYCGMLEKTMKANACLSDKASDNTTVMVPDSQIQKGINCRNSYHVGVGVKNIQSCKAQKLTDNNKPYTEGGSAEIKRNISTCNAFNASTSKNDDLEEYEEDAAAPPVSKDVIPRQQESALPDTDCLDDHYDVGQTFTQTEGQTFTQTVGQSDTIFKAVKSTAPTPTEHENQDNVENDVNNEENTVNNEDNDEDYEDYDHAYDEYERPKLLFSSIGISGDGHSFTETVLSSLFLCKEISSFL